MNWNHRIVDMTEENGGDPLFEIREVYYNDKQMPTGHCETTVMSETIEGLAQTLDRMKEALKHHVLKPEDFFREEEYEDPSDYVGMGWVGADGRP